MSEPTPAPATTRGVRPSWIFYRVLAYVVGVLLIVLVFIGVPLRYLSPNPLHNMWGERINGILGVAHGWLYALLLISAYNLGRRVRWGWKWLLAIALAGTIPVLSFVAEHFASKDVRAKLRAAENAGAPGA